MNQIELKEPEHHKQEEQNLAIGQKVVIEQLKHEKLIHLVKIKEKQMEKRKMETIMKN